MSEQIDRSDEVREMCADENDDPLAEMFNAAWLDTQEFPPLEYAVPGVTPKGSDCWCHRLRLEKAGWYAESD